MIYLFSILIKGSKQFRNTSILAGTGIATALIGCWIMAGSAAAHSGAVRLPRSLAASPLAAPPQSAEIVRFDHAGWPPVEIVRGGGRTPPRPAKARTVALVTFADPAEAPVTVIRGPASAIGFGLFAPASTAALDRVAFAVDGAESSHGADPGMWRPDPAGPQGPMQVSLAAALDVGGGDRFDSEENRLLGRAYLAHLYRRYGDWSDAVMAYNWGPARLDAWIAEGRPPDQLPLEVEHYRDQVLDAAGFARSEEDWPILGLQRSRKIASLAPQR